METLNRILNEMKVKCISQVELCERLNIKKQAVTNWKSGHTQSYKKYLPQIAEILDVSVDYLLGKEKEPSVKTGEFDAVTMQFIDLLGKLSQEQKEALIPLLESMIRQGK